MRISDWSSDVCSSDLLAPHAGRPRRLWAVDRRRAADHRKLTFTGAGDLYGANMANILIVEARFYEHLNDLLLAGARAAIDAAGHAHETVTVPGALEIPGAVALASESGRYDAYVPIGVVIRGETYHFEKIGRAHD